MCETRRLVKTRRANAECVCEHRLSLSLSLSVCVCVCIHVHLCVVDSTIDDGWVIGAVLCV